MDCFQTDGFAQHVEDMMARHHIPGLAIALVQGEEVVSRGYGFADVETKRPCTPETLFDAASTSKSMTAASVG